ncbi:hypothetical protein BH10PLA2_BH10PLA2_03480 [soil metagenome]
MGRILGALLLFGLAVFVIKLALICLVIAGLIFRTKETVTLLGFFMFMHLLGKYPITVLAGIGSIILFALLMKPKKAPSQPLIEHQE